MNALRCYVSEFISTFFFVLAAVGSVMASSNISLFLNKFDPFLNII